MERWNHAVGKHPGSKTSRCLLGYATIKDQLHHVWTSEVEILPDDLLEENAATQRTVQDLGQGELGLQNGQVIAVAGLVILGRVGMRQAGQPAAQQTVDLRWPQFIANGLESRPVVTGDEPIIQRLVADPFL